MNENSDQTPENNSEVIDFTQEIFEAIHGAMDAIVRRNSLFMETQVVIDQRLKQVEEKLNKLLDSSE